MNTKPKLTRWPIPLLDRLKACAAAEGVPVDRIVHIAAQQYIERSEARRGVGGQP
jgi:hypothetical protein